MDSDTKWFMLAVFGMMGMMGLLALLFLRELKPRPSALVVQETESGWVIVEKPLEGSYPAVFPKLELVPVGGQVGRRQEVGAGVSAY